MRGKLAKVDVLNGGDVDPTGRLLSVAEIQQAFRDLRQRREQHVAPTLPSRPHAATAPEIPGLHSAGTASAAPHTPATTPADAPHTSARADVGSDDARRLGSHWTAVIAAHSGAGASCVALALADALPPSGPARSSTSGTSHDTNACRFSMDLSVSHRSVSGSHVPDDDEDATARSVPAPDRSSMRLDFNPSLTRPDGSLRPSQPSDRHRYRSTPLYRWRRNPTDR